MTLNGKRNNLNTKDFLGLAEHMKLQAKVRDKAYDDLGKVVRQAELLLGRSFMSANMQDAYMEVLERHQAILFTRRFQSL